jgi:pilus assembly protein CpaE
MADKILIIDDDLETLRLIGVVLQRQGFQVFTTSNGVDGIALAQREKPILIVLDIMMPDLDGYQVTRMLRENPETAGIAILMFTAKTQVDDKIAGYDAGVDEYLTKPIHPAELVARIKSMLTAQKKKPGPLEPAKLGYSVVVLAPKGGLGSSTLALNLSIMLYGKGIKDTIAAEFRPGHGNWAIELNFPKPEGLSKLLTRKANEITPAVVEKELTPTQSGLRLLLASVNMKDLALVNAGDQMQAIFRDLIKMTSMSIIDLGNNYLPYYENILSVCQEIVLITEPFPKTVKQTRMLIDDLGSKGLLYSRYLTPVVLNRVRADLTMNVSAIQEELGQDIVHVISPAPELAYSSMVQNTPMVQLQPVSLTAQQFGKLADAIISRTK